MKGIKASRTLTTK